MGATMIRFGNSKPPTRKDENNWLMVDIRRLKLVSKHPAQDGHPVSHGSPIPPETKGGTPVTLERCPPRRGLSVRVQYGQSESVPRKQGQRRCAARGRIERAFLKGTPRTASKNAG